MSTLKKLAGETIIYGIGAVLPKIVNFLLVASYLTFLMNEEIYGIYGIMYSFVTFALVLFTLRMETTFFKFGSSKEYQRSDIFNSTVSLVLVSSSILLAVILLFNKQIASFLSRPEDYRYVIYFGIILFLDAITAVPFAKLRLDNRPVKFAFIKVMNSVITVGLIVFCFNGLPLIPSLSAYYDQKYFLDYAFLANMVGSVFILLMLGKEFLQFRWSWDARLVKNMLNYAWPLIIVGAAGAINQFSDRLFISYYTKTGEEQNLINAGLFNGAIKIAVIMNLFVTAFNYAAEPFFFKNTDAESRRNVYGKIALAFAICASVIFLGVMFYLDIIKYMIATTYHTVLYIVPVALLAYLFLGLYYNVSIWYKISGKTIYGAIIATIGTIIFVSLNLILLPKFGMIGATFASLACFFGMCLLAYFLGQKHYPIHYPVRKILSYVGSAVAIYYLIDSFQLEPFARMAIGTFVILGYLFIAYRLDLKKLISV